MNKRMVLWLEEQLDHAELSLMLSVAGTLLWVLFFWGFGVLNEGTIGICKGMFWTTLILWFVFVNPRTG